MRQGRKSQSPGDRSRGEATGHESVSETQEATEFQSGWSSYHRMDGGRLGEVGVCRIGGARFGNSDWLTSRRDLVKDKEIRDLFGSLILRCL